MRDAVLTIWRACGVGWRLYEAMSWKPQLTLNSLMAGAAAGEEPGPLGDQRRPGRAGLPDHPLAGHARSENFSSLIEDVKSMLSLIKE